MSKEETNRACRNSSFGRGGTRRRISVSRVGTVISNGSQKRQVKRSTFSLLSNPSCSSAHSSPTPISHHRRQKTERRSQRPQPPAKPADPQRPTIRCITPCEQSTVRIPQELERIHRRAHRVRSQDTATHRDTTMIPSRPRRPAPIPSTRSPLPPRSRGKRTG